MERLYKLKEHIGLFRLTCSASLVFMNVNPCFGANQSSKRVHYTELRSMFFVEVIILKILFQLPPGCSCLKLLRI
jgi:hypothetical protein